MIPHNPGFGSKNNLFIVGLKGGAGLEAAGEGPHRWRPAERPVRLGGRGGGRGRREGGIPTVGVVTGDPGGVIGAGVWVVVGVPSPPIWCDAGAGKIRASRLTDRDTASHTRRRGFCEGVGTKGYTLVGPVR